MSKEKKDMLKAILANTELIMAHLKIKGDVKETGSPAKSMAKKTPAKAAPKKISSRKK